LPGAPRRHSPALALEQPAHISLGMMKLSLVEDQAIQARIAFIAGAETFDRLFAGIRFDEVDGNLLFAIARDEDCASEIEDQFSHHLAMVATQILRQNVDVVVVLPKVLQ
jgi:hypothetical protein